MKYENLSEDEKTKFRTLATDVIGSDALCCTRSWSAWSHKTMSEYDFHNIVDDADYIEEKAEEIYNFCIQYNRGVGLKELIK